MSINSRKQKKRYKRYRDKLDKAFARLLRRLNLPIFGKDGVRN